MRVKARRAWTAIHVKPCLTGGDGDSGVIVPEVHACIGVDPLGRAGHAWRADGVSVVGARPGGLTVLVPDAQRQAPRPRQPVRVEGANACFFSMSCCPYLIDAHRVIRRCLSGLGNHANAEVAEFVRDVLEPDPPAADATIAARVAGAGRRSVRINGGQRATREVGVLGDCRIGGPAAVTVAGLLAGYGIAMPVGAIALFLISLGATAGVCIGAAAGLGAATVDGGYALASSPAGRGLPGRSRPRPIRCTGRRRGAERRGRLDGAGSHPSLPLPSGHAPRGAGPCAPTPRWPASPCSTR
jgi:hypothetical protein